MTLLYLYNSTKVTTFLRINMEKTADYLKSMKILYCSFSSILFFASNCVVDLFKKCLCFFIVT